MTIHPAIASDNVALVTGSGAGIGLAIAKRLADAGMKLVLIDNRADALDAAVDTLAGRAVMAVTADVSDRAALEDVRTQVTERFGGVDVLVNNAGIEPPNDIFGSLETWRKVLDVNLWGVINGCQVFIPGMLSRARPGLVINTGSKQGITAPPGNPA
ncbi:MAG: SDR family NAD(P)-dependent oxidoreductase [Litoreibacter sp.]|nr:SDR family NAD(P)-dependent oxidoreductase [Litoreibacter sp.]MCY4334026.1 SDR family NAD(P)-dependent oxidoreductase [Litoreibacter sp.]